VELAANAKLN